MKTRPLLGITLLTCLAAGVVAVGRPQEDRPTTDPELDLGPPGHPFEMRPSQPGAGEPLVNPPAAEATARSFLSQNQQLVARRVAELTERCDRLREELAAAEVERAEWQAIGEAMAGVPRQPQHFDLVLERLLQASGGLRPPASPPTINSEVTRPPFAAPLVEPDPALTPLPEPTP